MVSVALLAFAGACSDGGGGGAGGQVGTTGSSPSSVATGNSPTGGSVTGSGVSSASTGTGLDPGEPCAPDSPLAPVLAAMEPGSWKALPQTAMEAVCPEPGYACNAVMIAWSGGAFDSLHDRLIVWGGGHADSPYNNVFVFDLPQMKWHRLTELPWTGEVPPLFSDGRVETCGLYPRGPSLAIPVAWLGEQVAGCEGKAPGDPCTVFALGQDVTSTCVDDGAGNPYCSVGYVRAEHCNEPALVAQLDDQQPRSTHTYGNVAFSPTDGRFYVLGSIGMWKSGQSSSPRVSSFDFSSGTWSRRSDNVHADYGTSAADGDGNLWYLSSSTLSKYAVATDAWTELPSEARGSYYGGAAVDTVRKVLAVTQDGTVVHTYAIGEASAPYTEKATTGLGAALGSAPGFEYDARRDRFVAWSGGRAVHYLNPETYAWSTVDGSGDDPGPQADNGTFGRFRYSPTCDVYVTVSAADQDVVVFKPPATAP